MSKKKHTFAADNFYKIMKEKKNQTADNTLGKVSRRKQGCL